MSVTFYPADAVGRPLVRCSCDYEGSCEACQIVVNMANSTAAALLHWLDLPSAELYGTARGRDVARACEKRLGEPEANDPGEPERRLTERASIAGRPAGRLRERAARLLAIAERAGELGWVAWS